MCPWVGLVLGQRPLLLSAPGGDWLGLRALRPLSPLVPSTASVFSEQGEALLTSVVLGLGALE